MAKKVDRKARLDALREKLENTNYGGSGNAGFWSPDEGRNVVRILPEVGDMEFFYQTVGRHWMPDKTQVYCPSFTSEGELPCPVCELQNELWNAGDKASKSLAGDIRVKKSFYMNVMVRGKDGSKGPFIYTPGIMVFEALAAFISDPDYGDIFDEYEGLDVIINKSGSGIDTKYDVIPKRKSSWLMPTEEEIDAVFDAARDLSFVEVSDNPDEDDELTGDHAVFVLPYDRIVSELGLDKGLPLSSSEEPEEEEPEEEEEEEEPEEEEEAVQEVRRRRARRKR